MGGGIGDCKCVPLGDHTFFFFIRHSFLRLWSLFFAPLPPTGFVVGGVSPALVWHAVAAFEAQFPLSTVLRRLLSEGRNPATPRLGGGDGSFGPVTGIHVARVTAVLGACVVGGEREKRRLPPTYVDAWPPDVTKLPCTLPALVAWARVVPMPTTAATGSLPPGAHPAATPTGSTPRGMDVGRTTAVPVPVPIPVPVPPMPDVCAAFHAHLQALPRPPSPLAGSFALDALAADLRAYSALLTGCGSEGTLPVRPGHATQQASVPTAATGLMAPLARAVPTFAPESDGCVPHQPV